MKKIFIALSCLLALAGCSSNNGGVNTLGASIFQVFQGGTGKNSITSGNIIVGKGTNTYVEVASTSLPYIKTSSLSLSGETNYIPLWTSSSALGTSTIYQSSGNIGIGTASPSKLFDIFGSNVSDATRPTLRLRSGNSSLSIDSEVGSIEFYNNDSSGEGVSSKILNQAAASGRGGYLTFFTSPTGSLTLAERLRIDQSGNLGIGTTTPIHKLDVEGTFVVSGTSTFQGNVDVSTGATGSSTIAIGQTGNVGCVEVRDASNAATTRMYTNGGYVYFTTEDSCN